MAFIAAQFTCAGANSRRGTAPQEFNYHNKSDNIDKVTDPSYFGPEAPLISANDFIRAVVKGGTYILRVVSSDSIRKQVVIAERRISSLPSSFIIISHLDSFNYYDSNTIILENGVNYLVAIGSDVTSDANILLPKNYNLGGSLTYIGSKGGLNWNYTGSADSFISVEDGAFESNPLSFVLDGFNFNNSGASGTAVKIGSDIYHRTERLTLRNCNIKGFNGTLSVSEIDQLVIEDFNTDASGNPPTANISSAVYISSCSSVRVNNCSWASQSNQYPCLYLDMEPRGSAFFKNCTFKIAPVSANGLIIPQTDGIDVPSVSFENCQTIRSGFFISTPFLYEPLLIKTVSTGGKEEGYYYGKLVVETYEAHGLTVGDKVNPWGFGVDFSTGGIADVAILKVISTTKVIVDQQYSYNHDIYYGVITPEGFTTDPYAKISGYNNSGVPSPRAKANTHSPYLLPANNESGEYQGIIYDSDSTGVLPARGGLPQGMEPIIGMNEIDYIYVGDTSSTFAYTLNMTWQGESDISYDFRLAIVDEYGNHIRVEESWNLVINANFPTPYRRDSLIYLEPEDMVRVEVKTGSANAFLLEAVQFNVRT